jgi:hypothetical protein
MATRVSLEHLRFSTASREQGMHPETLSLAD